MQKQSRRTSGPAPYHRCQEEPYKVPGGKANKARLDTDLRPLSYLGKALKEKPNDGMVRQDAAALATHLAPICPAIR